MLANSRFVSVLLHDSNGAIVSSHMQSVLDALGLLANLKETREVK